MGLCARDVSCPGAYTHRRGAHSIPHFRNSRNANWHDAGAWLAPRMRKEVGSVMKMKTHSSEPLRLIHSLALVATVATALLSSMHAQDPAGTTEILPETAAFVAIGQRGINGPEAFVVPVSGAARIAEVRQYLADRAAGRETRPLIPTIVLKLGSDGQNRNHSAPGAPLWNWRVTEVHRFERYTRPEVEPAVFIPARDSTPSEIEQYLKGTPLSLPGNIVALRDFPIVMELRSESPRSSLANVSDRGFVGTGDAAKITGFIVDGGSPRNVVVRALGPTLATFGVTNALSNPHIAIYRGDVKIADNDDWPSGNLNRPHPAVVPPPPPFHLIPPDSREPAIELTLTPGAYTVIVTGVNGATGVVLTEVHTL